MTTDIETIKATVRSRLTTRLAPPANPIGAPFDHGDYIIEELAGDLIGFTRVNAFYDPTNGLPQDPHELDRYIASATANGWTKNNIYTYLDDAWYETEFEPGLTFVHVLAEDNYYGAYSTGWQELSIGGIDDYVTLSTDQNIAGQKTFDKPIGIGTDDPQRLLHLNVDSFDDDVGIAIGRYGNVDNYLSIELVGHTACYKIGYTGQHVFEIETAPGELEMGMAIENTPVNGPALSTPQMVVGEPTGSDMGIGSLNAEALYVNSVPVVTGTFDIDDYVTLTTDQNITGQKNFAKKMGIGTDDPQRLLHLNTDGSSRIGIGLGRYGDVDNYLTIDLDGNNAIYTVGYGGDHVFEVETSPGESEIGLWISGDYHMGPLAQAYQIVAGNPDGWGKGPGTINAEALYVNGEPVLYGSIDLSGYYTKTQLQTSEQSSVHWGNITNAPSFITGINWSEIGGTQSNINVSGFNNDAGYLTSLPSHNHDTIYYTKTQSQTSGQAELHWNNLTNVPSTFFPTKHASTHMPDKPDAVFPSAESWGYLVYSPSDDWMEWRKPSWGDLQSIPSTFPPSSHSHDTRYYTKTNLQTSGQSSIHWDNLTNVPSVFPPDDHNHDSRYPLKSLGYIRGSGGFATSLETGVQETFDTGIYSYSWRPDALNRPEATYGSAITFGGLGDQGKGQLLIGWYGSNENYIGFRSLRNVTDPWTSFKRIYHTGYKPQWDDVGSKPSTFPPANHSAATITSGTLSNSRLSFNPDYFVQGNNSRRSVLFDVDFPLDDNKFSAFFQLGTSDPANTVGTGLYGFRIAHPTLSSPVTLEIVGRPENESLFFGGVWGTTRKPWRQIHHSGVNYIMLDNNPAEVSHPTTSENLGTSNQTLHPTKGMYYAPGSSGGQVITMGNPQYIGQEVAILHNGQNDLTVYAGQFNPPTPIAIPPFGILRLKAINVSGFAGWATYM